MNRRWFQIKLKTLLLGTLIVAAYLAGRTPWERKARVAEAGYLEVMSSLGDSELYREFWSDIALEQRDDLRNSRISLWRERCHRFGGGGSYPHSWNDECVRPRFRRWTIAEARSPEEYLRCLKTHEMQILCLWHDPPRIQCYDPDSQTLANVDTNEKFTRSLILPASQHELQFLTDEVLKSRPRWVFKAIPYKLANHLWKVESDWMDTHDRELQDVHRTTFSVDSQSASVRVTSQIMRQDVIVNEFGEFEE